MSNLHDLNSEDAETIYQTLMREYPVEIRNIQKRQADDMANLGHISPKTAQLMDQLMNRVVSDNKRLGRT